MGGGSYYQKYGPVLFSLFLKGKGAGNEDACMVVDRVVENSKPHRKSAMYLKRGDGLGLSLIIDHYFHYFSKNSTKGAPIPPIFGTSLTSLSYSSTTTNSFSGINQPTLSLNTTSTLFHPTCVSKLSSPPSSSWPPSPPLRLLPPPPPSRRLAATVSARAPSLSTATVPVFLT